MQYFIAMGLNATLGVLLQLAAALCITLLLLAARDRHGGDALGTWSLAWLVQAVAVGTLVLRFILLPNLDLSHLNEGSPTVRGLYGVYGLSKIAFYALLAAGAVRFRGSANERTLLRAVTAAALVQAVVTASVADDLILIVGWTAPFAAVTVTFAAVMLFGGGRGRGARLTAWTFVAMAFLAALDAEMFQAMTLSKYYLMAPWQRWLHGQNYLVHYNSYIDTALHALLATGMLRLRPAAPAARRPHTPTPAPLPHGTAARVA